jgi:hypothetical protein
MNRRCISLLMTEHKIILRAATVLDAMGKRTADQRPPETALPTCFSC